MHRRRIAVFAGLLAPLVTAAGCSLINSYDAVKETPGGDDATTDDATGDDASSPALDGTLAETGSSSGGGDASGDATIGTSNDGAAETTTNLPEAAVDAGSPAGAIVIGGHVVNTNSTTTNVLEVLDPVTGNMKNQATMSVAGVAYDGALDVWYIFDTGVPNSVFATPGVPVTLHVRQLDTRPGGTWAWTELATLSVPPIFSGQQIAVLVDRLVYVSYAPSDAGGALTQLTVIDTTNLGVHTADASATPISSTVLSSFPNGPLGITGTPPTTGVGVGGIVALLQNSASLGDGGFFQFTTAVVNNGGTTLNTGSGGLPIHLSPAPNEQVAASTGTSVNSPGGSTGAGFLFATPYFDALDGGVAGGSLSNWVIENMTGTSFSTGLNIQFPSSGTRLNPIAFSSCAGVAIVTEGLVPMTDLNYVFALPLNGTVPDAGYTFPVTSVSGAAFEPYTNTVVATGASSQNNFIIGLQLGMSGETPTLSRLTGWGPPNDLVASWIAVRQPSSFQCPP